MLFKKNNKTCTTSLWKAWRARHFFHITSIFYIENFFYCILLKKHQFFRFQNFEDSLLKIFKYHIEKNTCRLFFNIECDKTYFFREQIFGCKLRMEGLYTSSVFSCNIYTFQLVILINIYIFFVCFLVRRKNSEIFYRRCTGLS